MARKVIKKECTVGFKCWYEDEPNKVWFESGYTQNGYCFKDDEAFYSKETVVCYIPENDDYWTLVGDDTIIEGGDMMYGFTYSDFLDICDEVEHLAQMLYDDVDWQYPETLLNEWSDDDDIATQLFNVSGDDDMVFLESIADIYNEERDGSDWGDLYRFYLEHKKQ